MVRFARYYVTVDEIRSQKRRGDDIEIKFVGLFDTVEAFGVPLEALRLAIDKFIWPISFRIEQMWPKVWRVRHALSLDDERTTFQPVRIKRAKVTRQSIAEDLLAYEPVKKWWAKVYPSPDARKAEPSEDRERGHSLRYRRRIP